MTYAFPATPEICLLRLTSRFVYTQHWSSRQCRLTSHGHLAGRASVDIYPRAAREEYLNIPVQGRVESPHSMSLRRVWQLFKLSSLKVSFSCHTVTGMQSIPIDIALIMHRSPPPVDSQVGRRPRVRAVRNTDSSFKGNFGQHAGGPASPPWYLTATMANTPIAIPTSMSTSLLRRNITMDSTRLDRFFLRAGVAHEHARRIARAIYCSPV